VGIRAPNQTEFVGVDSQLFFQKNTDLYSGNSRESNSAELDISFIIIYLALRNRVSTFRLVEQNHRNTDALFEQEP
jgi:hypothetical protein